MSTTTTKKKEYLEQIAKLDEETLKIIADLSVMPGIEKKLKDNIGMLKAFL